MTPEEFGAAPPGAKKVKATPPAERPVPEQIVSGAIHKKTSLGKKFKATFLGGDPKRAGQYILQDVIFYNIRQTIVMAIQQGVERLVLGESMRQRARPLGQYAPRIQYNTTSIRRDPREAGAYSGPHPTTTMRNSHDIGELILGSREEAQLLIEQLTVIADQYDYATVGQLYNLLGWPTTFTDEKWGWETFANVEIKQVSNGYLVDLPDPQPVG